MSKRRKPTLSLAHAMRHVGSSVPTVAASSSAPAAASAASSSSEASSSTAGKKRKRSNAQLISLFHQFMRQKDDLNARKSSLSASAYASKLTELDGEIEKLGGLEFYQSLSIRGHMNLKHGAFNTAHWVVDRLADAGMGLQSLRGKHLASGNASSTSVDPFAKDDKKLKKREKERERKRAKRRKMRDELRKAGKLGGGDNDDDEEEEEEDDDKDDEEDAEDKDEDVSEESMNAQSTTATPAPQFSPQHKVRLLDVGAITNHYLPYANYIDCLAIDLNPQHESVKKQDFFELDFNKFQYKFDVVVLSLVLNFVGDRFKRGEMIQRSVELLNNSGHARLFIILPSACLKNSRWMNQETFVEKCMKPLGLTVKHIKYSTKLCFFEFAKDVPVPEEEEAEEEQAEAEMEVDGKEGDEEEEEEASEGKNKKGSKKESAAKSSSSSSSSSSGKKAAPAKQQSKKKKKKGFQPAGIVLEGETRNNFSIAWKAK